MDKTKKNEIDPKQCSGVEDAEFVKVYILDEAKEQRLTEGDNMSILSRFKIIMTMSEKMLKVMIDMYNEGKLSLETRIALEAFDTFCKEDINI